MRHIDDEKLIAYLEGDITPDEAQEIEEHLKSCRLCYESYLAYRSIVVSIEEIPTLKAPDHLDALVEGTLRHRGFLPIFLSLLSSSLVVGAFYLLSVGIRYLWNRMSIGEFINLLAQAIASIFKAVYITRHLMEPAWVFAGVVALSIPLLIISKRRLERYAGIVD